MTKRELVFIMEVVTGGTNKNYIQTMSGNLLLMYWSQTGGQKHNVLDGVEDPNHLRKEEISSPRPLNHLVLLQDQKGSLNNTAV